MWRAIWLYYGLGNDFNKFSKTDPPGVEGGLCHWGHPGIAILRTLFLSLDSRSGLEIAKIVLFSRVKDSEIPFLWKTFLTEERDWVDG